MVFSAFPDEDLFEEGTQSLRMSSGRNEGINANNFDDFGLVDSGRMFGDSQNSDYLEGMLADSRMSAVSAMSTDFERMFLDDSNQTVESLTPVDHDILRASDSVRSQENKVQQPNHNCNNNNNNLRSRRRRRASQPSLSMKRLNDVNFDPTPNNRQKLQRKMGGDDDVVDTFSSTMPPSNNFSQQNPRQQQQRQTAVDADEDVALILASLNSSSKHRVALNSDVTHSFTSVNHLKRCGDINSGVHQEVSYDDALQKLADSIKRTERSRQQLMMQRSIIGTAASPPQPPQSRRAIAPARQQLQQHVTANPLVSKSLSADGLSERLSPNDRASILNDFFSGSRGTLTNGLEHSRRQLKMLNSQTLQQRESSKSSKLNC